MLNVIVISEYNFGKNLIASAYLNDFGGDDFIVECAGFEPGPLNPLVGMMMKQDGFDLSTCNNPYSVTDLLERGQHYEIVITVGSKRFDEKCPDFPGQRLRLNWRHPDPDKVVESRIDRLQQIRIMRDSIKEDVINFINKYQNGELSVLD